MDEETFYRAVIHLFNNVEEINIRATVYTESSCKILEFMKKKRRPGDVRNAKNLYSLWSKSRVQDEVKKRLRAKLAQKLFDCEVEPQTLVTGVVDAMERGTVDTIEEGLVTSEVTSHNRNEIQAYKDRIVELEAQLNENISSDIKTSFVTKKQAEDVLRLQKDIELLTINNKEKQNELQKLEESKLLLASRMESDIDDQKKSNNKFIGKITELKKEVAVLNNEMKLREATREFLIKEKEKEITHLDASKRELQSKNESLSYDKSNLSREIQNKTMLIDALQKRVEKYETDLATNLKLIDDYKSTIERYDGIIKKFETELLELTTKNSDLEFRLSELSVPKGCQEENTLNFEVKEIENLVEAFADAVKRKSELEEMLVNRDKSIVELQNKCRYETDNNVAVQKELNNLKHYAESKDESIAKLNMELRDGKCIELEECRRSFSLANGTSMSLSQLNSATPLEDTLHEFSTTNDITLIPTSTCFPPENSINGKLFVEDFSHGQVDKPPICFSDESLKTPKGHIRILEILHDDETLKRSCMNPTESVNLLTFEKECYNEESSSQAAEKSSRSTISATEQVIQMVEIDSHNKLVASEKQVEIPKHDFIEKIKPTIMLEETFDKECYSSSDKSKVLTAEESIETVEIDLKNDINLSETVKNTQEFSSIDETQSNCLNMALNKEHVANDSSSQCYQFPHKPKRNNKYPGKQRQASGDEAGVFNEETLSLDLEDDSNLSNNVEAKIQVCSNNELILLEKDENSISIGNQLSLQSYETLKSDCKLSIEQKNDSILRTEIARAPSKRRQILDATKTISTKTTRKVRSHKNDASKLNQMTIAAISKPPLKQYSKRSKENVLTLPVRKRLHSISSTDDVTLKKDKKN